MLYSHGDRETNPGLVTALTGRVQSQTDPIVRHTRSAALYSVPNQLARSAV